MNKVHLFSTIEKHFQNYCTSSQPLLLALSGGVDSLALFHALLAYQVGHPFIFHVAHIDHGWRSESAFEAEKLKQLADQYAIPFHLRRLNCKQLKGNLEQACRIERHLFFSELCDEYDFQGVFLGHHYDDQTETVLKRVLEGAHWSCLGGLTEETWIGSLRILRPFLHLTKNELLTYLKEHQFIPFEDSSNSDQRFLRARMRQTILPWLNQTFGKNVQSSLINLSQDMQEINEYFAKKINPLIDATQIGPFGSYLDTSKYFFSSIFEVKYLLRKFCERNELNLSREQYRLCAEAIHIGKANQIFECGRKKLHVDRKHLFLLKEKQNKNAKWIYRIKEKTTAVSKGDSNWKNAWKGECSVRLPPGNYQVIERAQLCLGAKSLNKWWVNHRVPACIRDIFPIICENSEIIHEFLTGKSFLQKEIKEKSIEIICQISSI